MKETSSDTASLLSDHDDDAPLLEIGSKSAIALLTRRVLICLVLALLFVLSAVAFLSHERKTASSWKGIEQIDHYFAFGDSWTDTRFQFSGPQPSIENPLGNPAFPGRTSSNGWNYVGYLTAKYNHTFIKSYNLGYSGATIDTKIDEGYFNWDDFTHRIEDFVEHYTLNGTAKGWQPENTLFSTFYGINDFCVFNKKLHNLDQLFAIYENNIAKLYGLSARNFVIFNVPPINESPLWKVGSHENAATIQEFNDQVQAMVKRLRKSHKDIAIFEYDVYGLLSRVITNPKSVPQTTRYKNTTGYCLEYVDFENTIPTAKQIQKCGGLETNDFLWLNSLHVTEPIHEAMAAEVTELLSRVP